MASSSSSEPPPPPAGGAHKRGLPKREIFDASKTGSIPRTLLKDPPKREVAVQVGFASHDIGFGLYAARDFKKDEYIFHEAPVIQAKYNEFRPLNNPQGQLDALLHPDSRDVIDLIIAAYPKLSVLWHRMPHPWQDAQPILGDTLGSRIVDRQGMLGEPLFREEEYSIYTEPLLSELQHRGVKRELKEAQEIASNFFRYYAFRPPALHNGAADVDASIYLLASLMNHRCMPERDPASGVAPTHDADNKPIGPNCTFRIGPQGLTKFVQPSAIVVQARRDISKGEELTWDYGKDNLNFRCMCADCVKPTKSQCLPQ
ncbi:hypothetical protein QBC38DRAFT_22411 [Podospora fimiseda]|uniref:Histone-lysine N-methyltransferase SET5 n=1 Tax=Podospora fimiseda TaxID=252190 RepID=A0AAN7BW99_9PEZI|nr:hypothetical protein QBC38DRAFT_22411 [Podospora fimiseda]